MLSGMQLEDGWRVVERIGSVAGGTGGSFSTPYVVERDGQRAFLKAIDFTRALGDRDPTAALEQLTRIFNDERELVRTCGEHRMRNVVVGITDGVVNVPGGGAVPQVSYMIFELADGDIRRAMSLSTALDGAWIFGALKQVALGIGQLHSAGIAHQDVKPSNVVTFETVFKLADLGRASVRGGSSAHDELECAGDPAYVTPEQMYHFRLENWDARRRSIDLYHLGSLMLFLLSGVNASAALVAHLDPAHRPPPSGHWGGTFDEVLVHLREANGRIVDEFPVFTDSAIRDIAIARYLELCDPDPRVRGHPKNRVGLSNPYSVERYVSYFNALGARSQRELVRLTHG